MRTRTHRAVALRGTSEAHLRLLHAMERGPASNAPAGTKPREWAAFHAPWLEILGDRDGSRTGVTPRVVLEEGQPAGSVDLAP